MRVRFWGVRGSIPVPGESTLRYGGNTPCVEIRSDEGQLIVIDAGTGIRPLGQALMKENFGNGHGEGFIFFSHTHWDHIQGFPFFVPAFVGTRDSMGRKSGDESNHFHVYGLQDVDDRLETTLRGQMEHPYFPVSLESMGSIIQFHHMGEESVEIGSLIVSAKELNHPNSAYGYRIENGRTGRAIVYCSDTEPLPSGELDENVVELAQDAEVFIYDAQYLVDEYMPPDGSAGHRGWGHSTWREAIRLARQANVKRLVLFHHDPSHDDEMVSHIEEITKREFTDTLAAYEGLDIEF